MSPDVRSSIRDAGHEGVQFWESGPYWATTNIGADKPEDFGLYFWRGDTEGHQPSADGSFSFNFGNDNSVIYTFRESESKLQISDWLTCGGVLMPSHDAAHMQWGGNWRMPKIQELNDLESECDWTWTMRNGVNEVFSTALQDLFIVCEQMVECHVCAVRNGQRRVETGIAASQQY